jgi:putative ABC transport system permease protein
MVLMKRLPHLASLRFLLRHPSQIILTTLGVALGVAVMVSIDLAIQSSREAFRISTQTIAGRSTHRVLGTGGDLPDSLFARIRTHMGVRSSAPVVEAFVTTPRLPGRPLRILGVDPFFEAPFRPFLLAGSSRLDVTLLLADPMATFVGRSTAEELGVSEGDSIPLEVNGRSETLRVRGILDPQDELSRLAVSDLLVVDLATAQELLDRVGRLSHIDLILPSNNAGHEMAQAIAVELGDAARLQPSGTRAAGLLQMTRAFDLNLTALSLLALIFGMFLIYNTMTFSVVQRRPILGELRALGVTRREISGLVLGEAAVLGVIGTGLGLLLGIVLGRSLVELVTRTLNDLYFAVSVVGLSLPPMVFVKGTLLGVGATLLASLPPALEAGLATPRSAMVRSELEEKAKRVVPRAALLGIGFFSLGCLLLALPSRSILLSFGGLFGVIMGTPHAADHGRDHGACRTAGRKGHGRPGGDVGERGRGVDEQDGSCDGGSRRGRLGHGGPRHHDHEFPKYGNPLARRHPAGRYLCVRSRPGVLQGPGNLGSSYRRASYHGPGSRWLQHLSRVSGQPCRGGGSRGGAGIAPAWRGRLRLQAGRGRGGFQAVQKR